MTRIESLSARFHRAIRHHGHFPNEHAAQNEAPPTVACRPAIAIVSYDLAGERQDATLMPSSGEPPADPADGLHHFLGAGLLELVAQSVNVAVDGA